MNKKPNYLKSLQKRYASEHTQGFVDTDVEGVSFFWVEEHVDRCPLVYDAGIAIVCQGQKVGYLDQETFNYDRDHYLIVSMTIPFECATYATPTEPLLGIYIDLDLSELHKLVAVLSQEGHFRHFDREEPLRGIERVKMADDMRDAVARLVQTLCEPMNSRVLGRSRANEVIYHALLGDHGSSLYALTQHNTHYNRIAKLLNMMREEYSGAINVDAMAHDLGMSTSVFHRSFKIVTGTSPLQYVKKMRLNHAKTLILHDGLKANVAARKVGYESVSQFSREFKKYFGVPPTEAESIGYEN